MKKLTRYSQKKKIGRYRFEARYSFGTSFDPSINIFGRNNGNRWRKNIRDEKEEKRRVFGRKPVEL